MKKFNLPSNLKFLANCKYVDEIITVVGVIFILGLFYQNYVLTDRIHTLQSEHTQAIHLLREEIEEVNELADKREQKIEKLHELLQQHHSSMTKTKKPNPNGE